METIIGLNEFLESYNNKRTRKQYENELKKYINYTTGRKRSEKKNLNEVSIEYIKNTDKDKAVTDLKAYIEQMNRETKAPYTIKAAAVIIKLWLEVNEINISKWQMKKIKQAMPIMRIQTMEQELDKEILFKIYSELKPREQAIFLIMTGSGTRITETTKIEVSDIDLENKIIYLSRKYTKNKTDRVVILTSEAAEKIKDLIEAKKIKSGRLFLEKQNFYMEWYKALKAIGYSRRNKTTLNRTYMIHPHMLRKWFLSQFSLYASKEVAELLAGHEGYLTNAYRRYSIDEIKREFSKAEKHLSIIENNRVCINMNCINNAAYYGACYEC